MVDYLVKPSQLDYDELIMGMRMRPADKRELWLSHKQRPAEGLRHTCRTSIRCLSGFQDGRLVAMWGVSVESLLGGAGVPWFTSSEEVDDHPISFLRASREGLEELSEGFALLTNYVSVDHSKAIRWLTWLGFTLEPPAPYGPFGSLFHRFTLEVE